MAKHEASAALPILNLVIIADPATVGLGEPAIHRFFAPTFDTLRHEKRLFCENIAVPAMRVIIDTPRQAPRYSAALQKGPK
jgi:hypothetical protein